MSVKVYDATAPSDVADIWSPTVSGIESRWQEANIGLGRRRNSFRVRRISTLN